jgi:hypothetical protein
LKNKTQISNGNVLLNETLEDLRDALGRDDALNLTDQLAELGLHAGEKAFRLLQAHEVGSIATQHKRDMETQKLGCGHKSDAGLDELWLRPCGNPVSSASIRRLLDRLEGNIKQRKILLALSHIDPTGADHAIGHRDFLKKNLVFSRVEILVETQVNAGE